ncbi:MAG: lysylphosphatidylglycerol synthase transmembrane domain-containing protein [Chloroflexota bacterium]|nr:lysylphosphatidylglycerol synthase transmembrane domain-containing protein [Chloroflexota bacterium]
MNWIEGRQCRPTSVTQRLKTYLPRVLSAAAVLIFATYLWGNIERYEELLDFSFVTLLSLASLAFASALTNGAINYVFYRALGVFLGFNESVGVAAVNTLANQLPLSGGLVAKGVYLKRRHQLAYTQFLSATTALYVCFVGVNGAIGLAVLAGWVLIGGTNVPLSLALGFCAMAGSLVALWVPVDAISLPGAVGRRLAQLAEGWSVLSENVSLVGFMTGLQFVGTLLFAVRLSIGFHALSQDATYAQCLLFSSATVLTRLVSIAPGGLGVREGIVAGLASVLGFEAGVSAVAVGLDRLVATAVIIALGTVYSYVLGKKVAEPGAVDGEEG